MLPRDNNIFIIGFLPFLLILGAALVVGVFFVFSKLTSDAATEIISAVATILLLVMLVLIVVTRLCLRITPVEHFDDTTAIGVAEAKVCHLIDAVNKYIQSDLGKSGHDDPSLVVNAQAAAAAAVDGGVTKCPSPIGLTDDERLTRMERTLEQLVEVQLKIAYDKAMTCEGFVASNEERLVAIHQTVDRLTKKYIDPLNQKVEDLKSGKVSACERRKGAATAIKKQ